MLCVGAVNKAFLYDKTGKDKGCGRAGNAFLPTLGWEKGWTNDANESRRMC
jgi:hypothetical protein